MKQVNSLSQTFIEFCKYQHDIECNQKYDKTLPYSFHLNLVVQNVEKFKHLLSDEEYVIAVHAAWGHDLIEDARVTFNDIAGRQIDIEYQGKIYWSINHKVAPVIFSCTELRGRNRDERKGDDYWKLLKEDRLNTFVKLCDIMANVSYGLITNGGMYKKYQMEFRKLKAELFRDDLASIFDYLELLLTIQNKR